MSTGTHPEHPPSPQTETYLRTSSVHAAWENIYLSPETERFYDLVFQSLSPFLQKEKILDAGCGTGVLTMRLAKHAPVTAVDLSEKALDAAKKRAAIATPYPVRFAQQNLCALTFRDGEFSAVFCWGVLMHIPDAEKALNELMRVTAPGGFLILGENNKRSFQSRLTRLLGRGKHTRVANTPAGREHWYRYSDGDLVARHADIRWLKKKMASQGFTLRMHRAAQFSEYYASVSNAGLRRFFHALNRFWFRLHWPGPALGNLMVWQRNDPVNPGIRES